MKITHSFALLAAAFASFAPLSAQDEIKPLLSPHSATTEYPMMWLGVALNNINAEGGPCLVSYVWPGSPAESAGLEPGDLLGKLDGTAVTSSKQIIDRVKSAKPGTVITLEWIRDGRTFNSAISLIPESQRPSVDEEFGEWIAAEEAYLWDFLRGIEPLALSREEADLLWEAITDEISGKLLTLGFTKEHTSRFLKAMEPARKELETATPEELKLRKAELEEQLRTIDAKLAK